MTLWPSKRETGKLLGFQNAQLLKEFLFAQLIDLIGEKLQLGFRHT